MKPVRVVGIRREFLKPDEIGKGRVMGLLRRLFGSEPMEDIREGIDPVGNGIEPKPGSVTFVRGLEEIRAMGEERAAHNARGQLILASDVPTLTATQLIEQAGDSVPALAQALTVIAERFETSVRSTDQLNRALGEFKLQIMQPFHEELRFLRFNLGDKVNQTTTNMEVMVDKLRALITAQLLAKGLTPERVQEYLIENGIDRAPSGPELEVHVAEHQGLIDQVAALTAQNHRLLAQLAAKHVTWPEDGGNWVYHEGCNCDACRAEHLPPAMGAEVSGAARSRSGTILPPHTDKKPAAKAPDRRKRRGA